MKQKGRGRTMKKNTKKVLKRRMVKLNTYKKNNKLKRNLEYLLTKEDNYGIQLETATNIYEKFLKSILKYEEKMYNSMNTNNASNFDIFKLTIEEQLKEIDIKEGNLLERIKKDSSDMYNELKEYISVTDNIIELYYEVLRGLRKMSEDDKLSTTIISDVSLIQSLLVGELNKEFLKKEAVKNDIIEDELMDLFKGLTMEKNDLSNIFTKMKL